MPLKQTETLSGALRQNMVTTTFYASGGSSTSTVKSENINFQKIVEKSYKSWDRNPKYRTLVKNRVVLPDYGFLLQQQRNTLGPHYVITMQRFPSPVPFNPNAVVARLTVREQSWHQSWGNASKSYDFTSLKNQVFSNLVSRAKSHEVNMPVFVAEGKKTVDMVVKGAHTLVDAARSLKRGDLTHFFSLIGLKDKLSRRAQKRARKEFNHRFGRDPRDAAASAWLEYSYGYVPLMMETRGAVNTLMDVVGSDTGKTGRVSASAHLRSNTTGDVQLEVTPLVIARRTSTVAASVRAVWRFQPNALDLPGRFGLTNPATIVWELVPFSFVADWFLPIGDYLSALDVPLRFAHKGGTWGGRMENVVKTSSYKGETGSTVRGDMTAHGVLVERFVLSGPPVPRLSSLRFDPSIGAARAVSAIALLDQTLRRF